MENKLIVLLFLAFIKIGTLIAQDENIKNFQNILGDEKIEIIDLLVKDFDNALNKKYPELSIENAYLRFLYDIQIDNFEFSDFNYISDSTNIKLFKSNLRSDLYQREMLPALLINFNGDYNKALNEISHSSDELLKEFYKTRGKYGIIQHKLLCNLFLKNDPDFSNYLHKRILVLTFVM
ncbi:hypothetical protein [Gramella sp. AN32]|uniref:Uncharacterized protein n=1 Tax=Christiangramia antarctica TaxID=2058158 RepID=A0ABW5X457_9FLAO|nr:hypothetical protein [Gramella sp. AN32]MCM4158225.1 hypothetical protein [Gramella sp. AN32]